MLIRWLTLTGAILVSAYLLEGIRVSGFFSALLAAAVLAALNAFLRPLLFLLTLPITILTMGLFTLVINAIMIKLAAAVMPGFDVAGFWPAVAAALVISLVDWLVNRLMNGGPPGQPPRQESGGPETIIDLKDRGDNRWE
jgi:putative membrane protein